MEGARGETSEASFERWMSDRHQELKLLSGADALSSGGNEAVRRALFHEVSHDRIRDG